MTMETEQRLRKLLHFLIKAKRKKKKVIDFHFMRNMTMTFCILYRFMRQNVTQWKILKILVATHGNRRNLLRADREEITICLF